MQRRSECLGSDWTLVLVRVQGVSINTCIDMSCKRAESHPPVEAGVRAEKGWVGAQVEFRFSQRGVPNPRRGMSQVIDRWGLGEG